MQTVNYKGGVSNDLDSTDGVMEMASISILDSKNLPIGLELTLQYSPDGDEMSSILRTLGKNYFAKQINPKLRDVVRDVASKYEAESIATKREEIGNQIQIALQKEFDTMPFTLHNVALRNIQLPPTVALKVKQVQEAKQEEQRLAMVEKQALVDKRIEIIKAEKVAEVNVTKASGEARAIKVKADAQAKANIKVARSLTPLLVQQNKVQKWDGVVPKYQLGSNTGMLMNVNQK